MSIIDDYFATIAEPEREALERLRVFTREMVPEAEEGQSYGMPAFKYKSRPLIGFIAATNHMSLYPFSPRVIAVLGKQLEGYELSKGTIRFSVEKPLTDEILRQIIEMRLGEITNPK